MVEHDPFIVSLFAYMPNLFSYFLFVIVLQSAMADGR